MTVLAQRALALTLATLIFWAPLGTVARAQEFVSDEARANVREAARNWIETQEASDGETPGTEPHAQQLFSPEAAAKLLARDMDVLDLPVAAPEQEPSPVPEDVPAEDPAVPLNLPTGPGKSAVTPQSVALPKGEGSIEGMGESFTPNLSSGTGTFSVPIALPKGRNGVQPSLALAYATSGGNGALGVGWSLATPFISRQTDKGLPRYVDRSSWHSQEDTFMYNGGQELVPVDSRAAQRIDGGPIPAELQGYQQYRARIEGAFMRFFRAPDSTHWVVQSKDGTRFDFGILSAPLPQGEREVAAVQADPEDKRRIFSWQLVRMSDVHGSAVHYRYREDGGTLYLDSIYYTSPDTCAAMGAPRVARQCTAPLAEYAQRVRLIYEEREDVASSYVTTWRVDRALRLKRIEITSAEEDVGTRYLVRRYHLGYDQDSWHSLLTSVQVEGRPSQRDDRLETWVSGPPVAESALDDAIVGELLPAMEFGYSAPPAIAGSVAGFGGIDPTVHESPMSPDHSVDEARSDLFDVNSDGLPDLLVTDPARYQGGVGVYFNGFAGGRPSAPGGFSSGVRVDVAGALSDVLNLGSANVRPMDVDGDGRSDMLHMPRNRNYGYFVLSKDPPTQGTSYQPTEGWSFYHVSDLLPDGVTDPRIDLGADAPHFKTVDVDNDHLIDIVRTTGSVIQTWLNLGRYPGGEGRFGSAQPTQSGWNLSTAPIESCLLHAGRSLDLADSAIRIADMNGDGLQDFVRVAPDEILWWPARGPGLWGEGSRTCDRTSRSGREIRMENPPRELNVELGGMHLADVNEDGAADVLHVGASHLSIWFNKAGVALTERLLVEGTPFVNDALERVRLADIDGSATTDIVYAESRNWRWIDPMGGQKPRLLTTVSNGLGALTTLEYSSSIHDYLRDLSQARSCDPGDLDCFTWQREPLAPDQAQAACDSYVLAKSRGCVHRAGGSPVVSTVVRRVKTSDRLDLLGAKETVTETEYRYHDGYYEGIEQEFRGFGAADAITIGDANEPTSITRTYFHQGRRPNDIAADRVANNPNEALKGREFLTEALDERGIYLSTSHAAYTVREILQGLNGVPVSYAFVSESNEYKYDTALTQQRPLRRIAMASVVRERARAGLAAVVSSEPESGDAPHTFPVRHTGYALLKTTFDEVDNLGQVRKQTAWGRDGRGEFGEALADERIVQHAVPVRVDDAACGDTGWLWRTERTFTTGADESVQLGDTTQVYTACGDVRLSSKAARLTSSAFNFSAQAPAASYSQSYSQELVSVAVDAWGQPTAHCAGADSAALGYGACLRLSTMEYEPGYRQLVARENVAYARTSAGTSFLTTSATWDRGLGTIRSATDPNGAVTEMFYDGLGRFTSSVLPNVRGCEGARVPMVRIAYTLTSRPHAEPLNRVTTTTLLSCAGQNHPDNQVIAHAYVDGLGRARAALAEGDTSGEAFEDGRPHPWVVSGHTQLTKKGQPERIYQAAFFDGSPDAYRAVLARPNVPYKRIIYDAFGRPTVEANEDFSYRSRSYHALSADVCDEVDNGFGADGDTRYARTCVTERSDGHGRAIDQHLRQRTLEGKDEQHRLFTYYRADGAVTRIVRALTGTNVLRPESGYANLQAYVERRFHYDTLGRRIASEDPDTDDRSEASLTRRTWRYLFNPAGDLVAVRDPRGCGQNFYYDLAGRLIGEAYAGCAESQSGELPSADVPAGSVALGLTSAPAAVHVRYHFDGYPLWAENRPTYLAGTLGRATGVTDRAQRLAVGYDARGNAIWGAKQLAVIADEAALTVATLPDGRPTFDAASEDGSPAASVTYDESRTYTRTASYDHAGRSKELALPAAADFGPGEPPTIGGRLGYHQNGAPRGAEALIDGVSYPVIDLISYTRDGLPARTRYGDRKFTGRPATESSVIYDARRRPVELLATRSPATGRTPETLGAVSFIQNQRLTWDGASNLYLVEDRRLPEQWPVGHKPATQRIYHDALYRVAQVDYTYRTPSKVDGFRDWREEEARHRASDPMRPQAAPMVAADAPNRVMSLTYSHDWLANQVSWDDDAHQFYERSLGRISNGNALAGGASPATRPAALYLASNLDPSTPGDLGGWLETDYGKGGNLLAMTVHAQCTHASENSCRDEGSNLAARRTTLRSGCSCAMEQHYVYRWDELNRLHEARRYDRAAQGEWELAARQRYRYDSGNQRAVKQTIDVEHGTHRAALFVYPGDFERRGVEVSPDGDAWLATSDSESQYLIAGARLVWKNRSDRAELLDPDHRITFAVTNLIQSTTAVVDLLSGELVEAGGFYPNGAREAQLGADDDVGGAEIPLEPVGFTGKEADEEVGLTYFGERYLVARIGRWATPDPLSVHAAGGGEAANSYHYVSGHLMQARDPLGLDVFFVIYYAREGTAFEAAGATRAKDIEASAEFDSTRDIILYKGVLTKEDFKQAWQDIKSVAEERGEHVRYGSIYSHAGSDLGNAMSRILPDSGKGSLEFYPDMSVPNQSDPDPDAARERRKSSLVPEEIAKLPQLPWTAKSSLDLRGCRTAMTDLSVAESFRDSQQTTVRGEQGYSSFSSSPNHLEPLEKGANSEVYLKAFYQGLFSKDMGENLWFSPLGLNENFPQETFRPNATNATSDGGDATEPAPPSPAERANGG